MEKEWKKVIQKIAAGLLLAALVIGGMPVSTSASNAPTVTKKLTLKEGKANLYRLRLLKVIIQKSL